MTSGSSPRSMAAAAVSAAYTGSKKAINAWSMRTAPRSPRTSSERNGAGAKSAAEAAPLPPPQQQDVAMEEQGTSAVQLS